MAPNTELYFPGVYYVKYSWRRFLLLSLWMKSYFRLNIWMKVAEHFPVAIFAIMLKNTQGDSNFWVSGWISQVCKFMWKISA